ncbi:hypothetical protein C8Q77DRAFT_812387 [Trametes polyzona]|nr:hypothetical protein C8Q77DRAFT_812387 [Trametes polyzona]
MFAAQVHAAFCCRTTSRRSRLDSCLPSAPMAPHCCARNKSQPTLSQPLVPTAE